jgi:transcriptional regulator with XRE-family HTH domain
MKCQGSRRGDRLRYTFCAGLANTSPVGFEEDAVKLGDVLRKEREGSALARTKGLSTSEVAGRLGITKEEYEELEAGNALTERWAPYLALIAMVLETPTARLLAETGRYVDAEFGRAGPLIKGHRERLQKSVQEVVEEINRERTDPTPRITEEEYLAIEAGRSPIEKYGPLLLGFAELIEQPVFNLFFPCGLPYQELDDYP